jgi:hypothetical protein
LLPGMFVRMRIPLDIRKAIALFVPDTAVATDQGGNYLLVVDKDNLVQQRSVRTGQLDSDLRVITSGIAQDDRVVIGGLQKAIPGAKVAPIEVQIVDQNGGGHSQ